MERREALAEALLRRMSQSNLDGRPARARRRYSARPAVAATKSATSSASLPVKSSAGI